jgi:xylose isomerase
MVQERYSGWDSGLGAQIENGTVTLEDCEAYSIQNGQPTMPSAHEEKFKIVFARTIQSRL